MLQMEEMMFTINDMQKSATEAWGPLGSNAVARWSEFNGKYFSGKLRPIPLVITNAQPYGRRLAFCHFWWIAKHHAQRSQGS
jgi:hypothetical protein